MTMLARSFPHPKLTITLAILWLALNNDVSLGQLIVAAIVGWAVPKVTSVYWQDHARIGNPRAILEYCAIVLKDIVLSNLQVANLVLFRPGSTLRSRFITVPLELRSAEAITVLAATITLTPGTLSADLSADGRALLVHCLDIADPDAAVADIKQRYERRLLEIFR